jgi:hypothetical protein
VAVPVPNNSAIYFARYYGTGMDAVAQLSQTYGVDVKDISSFGDWPFPANYLMQRIGWDVNGAKSPIHEREVTRVVTGYVSKCQLNLLQETRILYLFYSMQLKANYPYQKRALVVGFDFYPDGRLFDVALYNPSDESGARSNFDWHDIAQRCTPPAQSD